jgi:hypothetical protein
MYMLAAAAAGLVALLSPSDASAGTTTRLSAVPVMPAPAAPRTPEATSSVPGLTVKSKDGFQSARWHDVTVAVGRGYCLTSSEFGYRWMSSWGTSSKSTPSELDLDRLVEKDGKSILERTKVQFEPSDATMTIKGRSQVELREVARTPAGVVVWAFREGRDLVLLARNVERGVESPRPGSEDTFTFMSAEGCPFAGVRLDARKAENGALVQLSGALAAVGTGKERVLPRFLVDASLSRVGRDPDAVLAVSVRMRE